MAATCVHALDARKPLPENTFWPIFSTMVSPKPPDCSLWPIFSTFREPSAEMRSVFRRRTTRALPDELDGGAAPGASSVESRFASTQSRAPPRLPRRRGLGSCGLRQKLAMDPSCDRTGVRRYHGRGAPRGRLGALGQRSQPLLREAADSAASRRIVEEAERRRFALWAQFVSRTQPF